MPDSAAVQVNDVLVVGTGQAGFQIAASLRDTGFKGLVRLIGEEHGLPYQRPPLSKAYLSGKADRTSLNLRSDAFFMQAGIIVTDGRRVDRIDRANSRIYLEDNEPLTYGHLVLATGTRNRPLRVPGMDLAGVMQLRTVSEADALRLLIPNVKKIAIVGAGFIGLEFAAYVSALGAEVTVVEAAARPMARALSQTMSDFFRDAHEKAGIRFMFGAAVNRINGRDGHAVSVETDAGEVIPCDMVLVGIGVVPNTELAAEAGLDTDNGIVVDEYLRTTDPAISAVGDCAAFPQPFADGLRGRIESVQNAVDHARCVAARLSGQMQPYRAVPWFWSDQGPLKLQIAGMSTPHDHHVVRGTASTSGFSVFCFRNGRLVGVESVNKPGDHMAGRRMIGASIALTPDEAADTAFDLKQRASTVANAT